MSIVDVNGVKAQAGNPFSTRFVRPGALEYIFPRDVRAQHIIERLAVADWRGEIVGPHGSGKSTLLATLLPHLERAGREIFHIAVRGGQRRLPISSGASRLWNMKTLVIVDGYEQLGWLSRRWLDLKCRRRGPGLLVTAHESIGLPLLFQTTPSLESMQAVVARLLPSGTPLISPEDVASLYAEHRGNAREMLFGLYDLYELRRS
jgi:hypothetical protein